MGFLLLLGGARSGKSALAVEIGRKWGGPVTLVATGEAGDEERAALREAVAAAPAGDLVLVDCLTLWVSNLLLGGTDAGDIAGAAAVAAAALATRTAPAVVVSNEVGMGIVPDHPLGRAYRD